MKWLILMLFIFIGYYNALSLELKIDSLPKPKPYLEQDSIDFFENVVKKQTYYERNSCKTFAEIKYIEFDFDSTITEIPKAILRCKNLYGIDFSNTKYIKNWNETFLLLSKLEKLNYFVFEHTNMTEIPPNIIKLNINEITLRGHDFTEISYERLKRIKGNIYLGLDSLGIKQVSKILGEIPNLKGLGLSNNPNLDAEQVIEVVSKSKSLEVLNLSKCNIKKIPNNYGSLPKSLKLIILEGNPFWENNLSDLCRFMELPNIDVCDNLKDMPYLPECLKKHTSTMKHTYYNQYYHYDHITFVPDDSIDYYMDSQPSFLKKYAPWSSTYNPSLVFQNQWAFIDGRWTLPQLTLEGKDILLYQNDLIENYKDTLEYVTIVNVDGNENEIIEVLGHFPKLRNIDFEGKLYSFPTNINLLQNVENFIFYKCEFKTISDNINTLSKLETVIFSSSINIDIENIGQVLSNNKTLKSILLVKTQITYLPNSFCDIENLERIILNRYEEDKISNWTIEEVKALNRMPPNEELLFKVAPCDDEQNFEVIGDF